jgi:tripartite-type tricarboxylate transporter receptor subunit TctC
LRDGVSAAVLSAMTCATWAQNYPAHAVRIIIPSAPGGVTDIHGRLVAQWLSDRTGQSFVPENRSGAGGIVGTEALVRAPADGYTLGIFGPSSAIDTALYEKLSYDFIRDIVPVASLTRAPNVLVVHPALGVNTISDFISYAKSNPGRLSVASAGVGTSQHLAAELFSMMADIKMTHISYRGSAPALMDVIGGQVHAIFAPTASAMEHVRTGKLRALGVTSIERSDALPEVPAIAEILRGYEASAFFGIGAPARTPPAIVAQLNKDIMAAQNNTQIKARFADLGAVPLVLKPAEFRQFIVDETEKWTKVVNHLGIRQK